jgi:hypothetical protein
LGVQRLSWWLEWPAGVIRVGVVFLVCVTTVAVVVHYPALLRKLDRDATRNSSLSYADREVAGGNGVVADQSALYEARGRIPENESYHVAVGADYEGGSDLTIPFVESYYQYFLLPRRPADDAPWLICYGCDLEQYGARAEVVWESDEGISIARIRR